MVAITRSNNNNNMYNTRSQAWQRPQQSMKTVEGKLESISGGGKKGGKAEKDQQRLQRRLNRDMVKKVVKKVGKKVQNVMRKGAEGVKKLLNLQVRDHFQRQQEKMARKAIRLKSVQLFKDLKKEYVNRNRLDKDDKRAVEDYTGPGYGVINQALRSGNASAELQTRIDAVLRAMSKPKLRAYQGTVYRGTVLPEEIMDTLRPGATFSDSAFLSSSSDKSKAFGGILFVITSKTGQDVSKYSHNKKESEVLFRPSTMFKIKSVESGVVTMEELA